MVQIQNSVESVKPQDNPQALRSKGSAPLAAIDNPF